MRNSWEYNKFLGVHTMQYMDVEAIITENLGGTSLEIKKSGDTIASFDAPDWRSARRLAEVVAEEVVMW